MSTRPLPPGIATAPLIVAACATAIAERGARIEAPRCALCGVADVRLAAVPEGASEADLRAAGFGLQPLGPGRREWLWRHACEPQ